MKTIIGILLAFCVATVVSQTTLSACLSAAFRTTNPTCISNLVNVAAILTVSLKSNYVVSIIMPLTFKFFQ